MNVPMLLSPKSEVRFLLDSYSLRQGLETMRAHGYTALPVIDKDGKYIGSVNEGDFLWYIVDSDIHGDIVRSLESRRIREIIRPTLAPPVNIDADMDTLVGRSMAQNFVPVIDDRGTFIGIVTRRSVIGMLKKEAAKFATNANGSAINDEL